jgi:hypothetical protein
MRLTAILTAIVILCLCACERRGPATLEELAVCDTAGWAHDVAIREGKVYVSDRQGGYLVFERTRGWRDPAVIVPVADVISLEPGANGPLLAARFEGLVQVADGSVSGRFANGDIANAVVARGDLAFVAYGLHGLVIARVRPTELALVAELPTPGWSHDVKLRADLALLADWNYGLRVVDIRDPRKPVEVAVLATPATSIAIEPGDPGKGMLAVAEGHAGIALVSIDESGAPSLVGRNTLDLNPADPPHPEGGGWAHDVAWAGRYLFVANWKAGISVLDAVDTAKPRVIMEQPTSGTALGIAAEPQPDGTILILLADGEAGLRVLRFRP